MANYATLKAALDAAIYTNTQRAITGDILNAKMDEMINALGAGYQYMGEATPSTNPGSPDSNVVYLATTSGTYTNFGGLTLASGKIAFLRWNGSWAKDEISVQAELTIDSQPTSGSGNPVASGGVFAALSGKQQTIDTVNVTVDNNSGVPSGTASVSGNTMNIALKNIKGEKGDTGEKGNTGLQGPQGPQGPQGNPGSSQDYPFELENDPSVGGTAKAATAESVKTVYDEVSQLPDFRMSGTMADLALSDDYGNDIVRFEDGGIVTKNFDSRNYQMEDAVDVDLAVADENNKRIVEFASGHIRVKKFNSQDYYSPSAGKPIMFVGDSYSYNGSATTIYGTPNKMFWEILQETHSANVMPQPASNPGTSPYMAPAKGGIPMIPPTTEDANPSIWYRCAGGRMTGWKPGIIGLLGGRNDSLTVDKLGTVADAAYVDNATGITDTNIVTTRPATLTYAAALKGCILMLKRDFPNANIVLWSYLPGAFNNATLELALATLQMQVAEYYGLTFVPIYFEAPQNVNLLADGSHAGFVGAQIQAKCWANYIALI